MADMKNVIAQKISNNEKSICEKCSHRRVCRAIDNQPCFECNQFEQEVVRCKDCVSGHKQIYGGLIRCNVMGCGGLKPDDFCSYGEGRVGE